MQLKEKKRNEVIEQKKRLEKHRKAIEDDVAIQEKTTIDNLATDNLVADNLATKKKVTKKRIIDKKAIKERQKTIPEKVMEEHDHEGKIEKSSEEEETKIIITKEERAERFKRLHAMVLDMTQKQKD